MKDVENIENYVVDTCLRRQVVLLGQRHLNLAETYSSI